ncbi:Serine/threonine-protein kinase AfsK [Trueperella bernardiae]|uniref:Serine/threonine-protein kinase AfsK n=1 Tax=Trueperella bernardiae TaxID=59561 RepID=A0A0W1KJ01_9ACTO|nr:serine/threonine-protein kinase [Trueperella bernardiae]KTF03500.1 Serine/threonine-protein kinase AfsK [Trueperella bernardiae]
MRQRAMIGGYRIVKRIGSGGMSFVYQAVDADGRDVALKLLHPELAADPRSRERLRREVAMLQRVRGKYVAQILDAETDEEEIFLVTELIDGPTLDQDVRDSGRYEGADLVELGQELAAALESIHDQGVLHRDLKPSNVMMGEEGPVLIDFGIAQLGDDLRMTQTGALTHTPGFCDPVVVRGGDPDADADWWALAAVLAFAATGQAPFGVGNSPAVMHRVVVGEADLPGLAPEVERAFRAALAPRREERITFAQLMYVLGGASFGDVARTALHPWPGEFGGAGQGWTGEGGEAGVSAAPSYEPPVAPAFAPMSAGDETAGDTVAYGPAGPGGAGAGRAGGGDATRPIVGAGSSSYSGGYSAAQPPVDATAPLPVADPTPGTGAGEGPDPSPARTSVFERMLEPEPAPPVQLPGAVGYGYGYGYPAGQLPAWAVPPRKARLQVWVASIVVGLFALVWPVTSAAVMAALIVALSWLGGAQSDLRERRMRNGGPYQNDVMGAVLRSPLTLIGAVARSVVSVGVGAGVGWLTWLFLDFLGALPPASGQAVGVYVGVVVAWFIAPNENGREGVRYLMEGIAPTAGYRLFWIATTLLVALAAGVVVSQAHLQIV